ncbi:MAG: hypothetical protein WC529_07625 [Candidatus Margulisiibacteriota bacterium]
MKKIIALTLLLACALSVAALAAPKRSFTPAPAVAPVSSAPAGDDWSGKMALGCIGGTPAFKYHFNKDMMVAIGGNYFTFTGGSQTTLLGKFDYTMGNVGGVQTMAGGYITSTSVAGASQTTFGGTWGFRTLVQPNMSLGADIILLSSTSAGGATTTGILPGVFINAGYYL